MARSRTRQGALENALWRGLDVFRTLSMVYAALSAALRDQPFRHPAWAVVVLCLLGAWTLLMVWWRRRDTLIISVELALACAAILLTRWIDDPILIAQGATTLPATWSASPVMGFAIRYGGRGGLGAALVIGVADLLEVGTATDGTIYNIVLLALLGGCLGWCVDIARRGQRAIDEANRVRAEAAERERLARTIHDGVLQTLAFIHRRGEQIGGECEELGRLAGEQERVLRDLATGLTRTQPATGGAAQHEPARPDIRPMLTARSSGAVEVICPAEPVEISAPRAILLVAAVGAALDNVAQHAGPDAKAWVLLEDVGDDVMVTIRDNGVGMAPDRLDEAAAQGRLGVVSSIRGRLTELAGEVTYRSTPGRGTTVVLRAPKEEPR